MGTAAPLREKNADNFLSYGKKTEDFKEKSRNIDQIAEEVYDLNYIVNRNINTVYNTDRGEGRSAWKAGVGRRTQRNSSASGAGRGPGRTKWGTEHRSRPRRLGGGGGSFRRYQSASRWSRPRRPGGGGGSFRRYQNAGRWFRPRRGVGRRRGADAPRMAPRRGGPLLDAGGGDRHRHPFGPGRYEMGRAGRPGLPPGQPPV